VDHICLPPSWGVAQYRCVRCAHAVASESAIFDHVRLPSRPSPPRVHLCLRFIPRLRPPRLFRFPPLSSRYRDLPSSSQAVFFVAQQNSLPKNSRIAHIGSADVKNRSRHHSTLYALCAASADRPGLPKWERSAGCT